MKKKIRLIGHDPWWDKVERYNYDKWQAVADDSYEVSIYIDIAVNGHGSRHDNIRPQYALLYEPPSIIPECYNNIDLSLYTKVFTHNRAFAEKHDNVIFKRSFFPPWVDERGVFPKSKLISMFCSGKQMCREHTARNDLARLLLQHHDIDVFGAYNKNRLPNKEAGLKDYAFNVVVENYWGDVFFTEKLQDCFLTGTIPIFLGCPAIAEIFDADGIIFLEHPKESWVSSWMSGVSNDFPESWDINTSRYTMELYESKKKAVENNYKIMTDMLTNMDNGLNEIVEEHILND